MAAPSKTHVVFFQPQQYKYTQKPPCAKFDLTAHSNARSYYDSTTDAQLQETQAPLGVTAWQEGAGAFALQESYSYNPYDNALFPSALVDFEPLNVNNPAALLNEHHTTFDNPAVYNFNSSPPSPPSGSNYKSDSGGTSPKSGPSSATRHRVEKREANTLAARRYRQKRLDKVAELESALKATQLERDALREQVAKLEGENLALKDMNGGGG